MTKEEILLSGLEYYTVDPDNRRCVENCKCTYSPKTINKETSEGCWVGRLLDSDLSEKMDKLVSTGICYCVEELDYEMPEWVIENVAFLEQCQTIHDNRFNWNKHGLSDLGKQKVKSIAEQHKISITKIKKYL